LFIGVQQPEDIFSIVRMNLRAWFNVDSLGTNNYVANEVEVGLFIAIP